MKRIFYALIATTLVIGGCGKQDDAKEQGEEQSKIVSAEEEEARAMEELVKLLEEEKSIAENMGDDDFLDEEAAAQLLAWEVEQEEAENAGFKTLEFPINSHELTESQKEALNENVERAKETIANGGDISIYGHGCPLGPEKYNLALSEKRAETVKDELVTAGIPADRIHVVGCGATQPLVWTTESEKDAQVVALAPNRRVEILAS